MFEEELSQPEVQEILSETVDILTNQERNASLPNGKDVHDVLDNSAKGLVQRRRVVFEGKSD